MMKQFKYSIIALLALVMAPACTQVESSSISSTDTTSSSVSSVPELSINEVSGLEDITWSRNEYFDSLRGVMITNDQNEDITKINETLFSNNSIKILEQHELLDTALTLRDFYIKSYFIIEEKDKLIDKLSQINCRRKLYK